jgi:hypothetical protein
MVVIATASAVRTFLIPETLDSTPFFPDALAPSPDALAIRPRSDRTPKTSQDFLSSAQLLEYVTIILQ